MKKQKLNLSKLSITKLSNTYKILGGTNGGGDGTEGEKQKNKECITTSQFWIEK